MSKLLAPNGKPSNLTPEQYALVRTPEFKAWFGFWDIYYNNLALDYYQAGVRETAHKLKTLDAGAIKKASEFLSSQVTSDDVLISMPSRSGCPTDTKVLAELIASKTNAKIFNCLVGKERESVYDLKKQGQNISKFDFDFSVVGSIPKGKRYFIVDNVIGTGTTMKKAMQVVINNVGQNVFPLVYAIDPNNVSKVVDENGEPLVVYHTSSNEINVFRVKSKINTLSGKTINIRGAYFTANPKMYQYKGSNMIKCFLHIKNPTITTDQLYSGLINEEKYRTIFERGSDGVVLNLPFINEKNTEIVVFEPNQIKLADGTNTTFDENNPDIRYEQGGTMNSELLAPNGKPSNLTLEQYALVRTPQFKAWFGDWENNPESASKIVDENGEPLMVFHGTNSDFYEFDERSIGSANDEGFYGRGFYFTFQKEFKDRRYAVGEASYYGKKLLTCYIKALNPFDFQALSEYKRRRINYFGAESLVFLNNIATLFPKIADEIFIEKKIWNSRTQEYDFAQVPISVLPSLVKKYAKLLKYIETKGEYEKNETIGYVKSKIVKYDYTDKGGSKGQYEDFEDLGRVQSEMSNEAKEIIFIELALDKYEGLSLRFSPEGYMTRNSIITDAIKEKHDCILQSQYGDELVVFSSNQIKLADGTNTTFNKNNPDIRYSKGGNTQQGLEVKLVQDKDLSNELLDIAYVELGYVAQPRLALLENGKIIGGIFLEKPSSYIENGEYVVQPMWEYKFDIVIVKSKRNKGYSKILLDAMIQDFVSNFPDADQIRAEVTNKKLEKSLKKNYGFSCDSRNDEKITYCYLSKEDAEKYKNNPEIQYEKGGSVNTNLRKVKVNKTILHRSNPTFRASILKKGLVPKSKSETWLSDTNINGKVIFATNTADVNKLFDSGYDDDIYEIDTTALTNEWYLDPNFSWSDKYNHIITFDPIPISAIKLVYRGSGKSNDNYAKGGTTKKNMKKIDKGGITYGRSHAEGGIPVKNESTGEMLEVEGGEGIINKKAMASPQMVKIDGKEMTICEAASYLNQKDGNGRQFNCDDVEHQQFLTDHYGVGGELKKGIATEKEHSKTLNKLYNQDINPNQAIREVAKEHIKENPNYYSDLHKMKGKMAKGGTVMNSQDAENAIFDATVFEHGGTVNAYDAGLHKKMYMLGIEVMQPNPISLARVMSDENDNFCEHYPKLCAGAEYQREELPQIYDKNYDEFVAYLENLGATVNFEGDTAVDSLKPVQNEISLERMARIMARVKDGYYKDLNLLKLPLFVSQDGYILDGHHRWATLFFLSPTNTLDIYRVNLTYKELVDNALNFDDAGTEKFMIGGMVNKQEQLDDASKITLRFAKGKVDCYYNFQNMQYSDLVRIEGSSQALLQGKFNPILWGYTSAGQFLNSYMRQENSKVLTELQKTSGYDDWSILPEYSAIQQKRSVAVDFYINKQKTSHGILELFDTSLPNYNMFIGELYCETVVQYIKEIMNLLSLDDWRKRGEGSFIASAEYQLASYFYQLNISQIYRIAQDSKNAEDAGQSYNLLKADTNFVSVKEAERVMNKMFSPPATQTGWNWRFKTEQEFIDEYGTDWEDSFPNDINWGADMDEYNMSFLFGQPIAKNPTSTKIITDLDFEDFRTVNVREYFGVKNPNPNGSEEFAISSYFITEQPLPTAATPTTQTGWNWRFKTEQEFIDQYGTTNWKSLVTAGVTEWEEDMDYLLGQQIVESDESKEYVDRVIEYDTGYGFDLKRFGILRPNGVNAWEISADMIVNKPLPNAAASTPTTTSSQVGSANKKAYFGSKQDLSNQYNMTQTQFKEVRRYSYMSWEDLVYFYNKYAANPEVQEQFVLAVMIVLNNSRLTGFKRSDYLQDEVKFVLENNAPTEIMKSLFSKSYYFSPLLYQFYALNFERFNTDWVNTITGRTRIQIPTSPEMDNIIQIPQISSYINPAIESYRGLIGLGSFSAIKGVKFCPDIVTNAYSSNIFKAFTDKTNIENLDLITIFQNLRWNNNSISYGFFESKTDSGEFVRPEFLLLGSLYSKQVDFYKQISTIPTDLMYVYDDDSKLEDFQFEQKFEEANEYIYTPFAEDLIEPVYVLTDARSLLENFYAENIITATEYSEMYDVLQKCKLFKGDSNDSFLNFYYDAGVELELAELLVMTAGLTVEEQESLGAFLKIFETWVINNANGYISQQVTEAFNNPISSVNTVQKTQFTVPAPTTAPTTAPTQQKGLPSTDKATWFGTFRVGDNVKIRYDYSTDMGGGESKVDYFSTKNQFKIIDKSSEPAIVRPENATGFLYKLDNGQTWEGKDLELIGVMTTPMPPSTTPLPNAVTPATQKQVKSIKEIPYLELLESGVLTKTQTIVGARFMTLQEMKDNNKKYDTSFYGFYSTFVDIDFAGYSESEIKKYYDDEVKNEPLGKTTQALLGEQINPLLLKTITEVFKFQKSLDPKTARELFKTSYTIGNSFEIKTSRLRFGQNNFGDFDFWKPLFPKINKQDYEQIRNFDEIFEPKYEFPSWYKNYVEAFVTAYAKSEDDDSDAGRRYILDNKNLNANIQYPYNFFTGLENPDFKGAALGYTIIPFYYLVLKIEDTSGTSTATKKKVKTKETVYYKELLEKGMPSPKSKIVGARFLTNDEITDYNKKYGTSLAGLELSLDGDYVQDKKSLKGFEKGITKDVDNKSNPDAALKWSGNAILGNKLNPKLLPMAIVMYEFDKENYPKNNKSLYLTSGLEQEESQFLKRSRLCFGSSAEFDDYDFWKPLFPKVKKMQYESFENYPDINDYEFPDWYKAFLKEVVKTEKEYYTHIGQTTMAADVERNSSVIDSLWNVPRILTGMPFKDYVVTAQSFLLLPMNYLMFEIETEEDKLANSTAVKKLKEEYAALQYYLNVEVPIDAFAQRKLISSAMETVSDNLEKEIEALYYSPSFEPLFEFWAEKQTQGQRMIDLQPCMLPTPNGEKSELDLVQYEIVRSEEFKKWFGDWEEAAKTGNYNGVSKAINPLTKEPQVVFHGKANMVLEFSKMAFALFPVKYFGTNLSYAEWFKINQSKSDRLTKLVYEFFVDIKNPIDLSPIGLTELTAEDLKEVIKAQYNYEIQSPIAGEGTGDKTKLWRLIRGSEQMLEELKANTYFDGLIMYEDNLQDLTASGYDTGLLGFSPNSYELVQQVAGTPIGNFTLDFVTFTNFQIKAADGRNTTFFNNVEDFRFAKGGITKKRKK